MPFRLSELSAKIQFITSAQMPSMIYRACLATGTVSNTVYIQRALAEALARDLNIPVEDIMANLPAPRGPAAHLYEHDQPVRIGPGNTIETVR
jgi:hypothetical protein